MVKLMFCLRRHPDLTGEQFQATWLNEHAPLVRRHAAALRIKRYVQSHTFEHAQLMPGLDARGAQIAPYDGVAELWWESLDDLFAAAMDPEGRAGGRACLADERRFIDLKNSPIFYTEEHVIIA